MSWISLWGKRKAGESSQPASFSSPVLLHPTRIDACFFLSPWPPSFIHRCFFIIVSVSESSFLAASTGLTTYIPFSFSSIYSCCPFLLYITFRLIVIGFIIGLTLALFSYCKSWSCSNLLSHSVLPTNKSSSETHVIILPPLVQTRRPTLISHLLYKAPTQLLQS